MKKVLALLLVLVMVLGLVACGGGDKATEDTANTDDSSSTSNGETASGDTVTIGVSMPLTGSVALNGEMILQGIQMAVDEANEAGGINGMQIVVDAQDDQALPDQAASIANKFVSDDAVVAVIGCLNSSCTLAAAPIAEDAGLVYLSPDSSSAKVTDAGDYIFRIKDSDMILQTQQAEGAIKDGHKKFAIAYVNNDYGVGGCEILTQVVQDAGLEVVATETILAGEQTDFSTSIANIKAAGADALLTAVDYNEAGLFVKQMADAGLDIPVYATDGLFTQAYIEVAGDAANGTTVLTSFHESNPDEKVQNFIKDFKAYTGKDENPSVFQAEGYDAAKIVIEAITNAGTDRTAIRDYMSTMSYIGVIGDCTFDENGDVNIPLMRCIIEDGKFVPIDE